MKICTIYGLMFVAGFNILRGPGAYAPRFFICRCSEMHSPAFSEHE